MCEFSEIKFLLEYSLTTNMHNEIYIKVFPQCVSLGKLNFCIQGNDREREREIEN